LIDTGPNTPEAYDALVGELQGLGVRIKDLGRIVITHAHADHYGLVERLVEESGAEVWAHPRAQPVLEDSLTYRSQRLGFWLTLLLASGVPEDLAESTAAVYRGLRRFQSSVPVTKFLTDLARIELAGRSWQVLFCPGHAGNLVCFYDSRDRVLIGSDHLLAHISSNALVEPTGNPAESRPRPLIDYWASLCRVYEIDIALVLPGHGPAIADPRGLIKSRFGFYERRLGRLRAELQLGPRTVWQLVNALFRKLDLADTFLAVSEVVGHLDVLEQKGEVVCSADSSGLWHYELIGSPA
jgi:glyoxylase-like metal-dependent hydrolase (beta-lactamase superfamily II)